MRVYFIFKEGGSINVTKVVESLGFLGPKGTHSEEVALYLNSEQNNTGKEWKLVPYTSIYDAICAVEQGKIDRCVVPVENSIEGSINITLDTLAHDVDLQIEREIIWAVHNQLMVKNTDDEITTIISHPQPLAQCRSFIKEHYPQAEIRPVSSTARAAKIVAEGKHKGYAVIGCHRAGTLYSLTTIATEIQDNTTNCTRFLILTKPKETSINGKDKTSIICQINGKKAGSLCEVLLEFAKRDVNLTRIESRPARTGLGKYIFFLDLEDSIDKVNVKAAIKAVAQKSLWLKNLGSFNVIKIDHKPRL
ncbi:MAG: pheA [Massilibacillus sp.]|jgi:prephenate dehydratase|nr:pheA [Massilibacillus sp.]